MTLKLKTLTKESLSIHAAPYRVTTVSGKQFFYKTLREIKDDLKPGQIETIYDRHKRRIVHFDNIGHKGRKRKHEKDT